MIIMQLTKLLLLPVLFSQVTGLLDPISLSIGGGIMLVAYLFTNNDQDKPGVVKKYIGRKTGFYEGCEDYWIPGNVDELERDLRENIFGQPAALDIVLSAIKKHLYGNSKRALMLSFHGSPGTGKNYVSSKILKQMFRNGERTEFVFTYRSSIHFPLKDKNAVEVYQKNIIMKIKEMVNECHRSIIMFDEVEKMPGGILDVLSGFVKAGKSGDYDFRRIIFILLSNSGSDLIFHEALNSWEKGERRDVMDIAGLNEQLTTHIFNEEGGFYRSGLIRSYGITHFVPFLPLEKNHVIQCMEKEVMNQGQNFSHEIVEQVLQELTFVPKGKEAFSFSGCKRVGEIAAMLIEREKRRQYKARSH